ncbi:hypothetical protein FRC03_000268 [Tulasnella sp. 419]|nr:hypothetical protein FRC03_000268 [Tulasnella sp. 419]
MEVDQPSEDDYEDAASEDASQPEHHPAEYSDGEEASSVPEKHVDSQDEEEPDVDYNAPIQRPWPSTLGLNPRKVNVMQASFFHTGTESKSPTPIGGITAKRAAVDDEGHLGRGVPQAHQIQLPLSSSVINNPPSIVPSPTRTLEIGKQSDSLALGSEATFVDAGLSMGRCFGARWGPHGKLMLIGGKKEDGRISRSQVNIVKPRILASDENVENERTQRLLTVQIERTTIETDDDGIPVATPTSELRFRHYASLFAGDDRSHEASVWRLGVALFDEMDLQVGQDVSWDVEQAVRALRYRTALSDWLESAVAPAVETALGDSPTASNSQRVFTLMTGHQIERAAQVATDAHNFNLAMLVSQAGGDEVFRADLRQQLAVWKDQKADGLIEGWYRRIYAILGGITDILEGSKDQDPIQRCGDERIQEGLDWKRSFGLQLWYGTTLEQPSTDALAMYIDMYEQRVAAPPLPWYIEDPNGQDARELKDLPWPKSNTQYDALFELIRMYMDQRIPLESVLLPRGFTPSPFDHRMSWHLYILLASVLKYRDFGDRREVALQDTERSPTEVQIGTSELAQTVTVQYAYQLACLGRLEDAVFVLLHLEQPEGRKIAIQNLLREWVGSWDERLIVDSLKVPQEWVSEAYGILASYENKPYDAFEHFLEANQQQLAHDLAVYSLSREVVIRGDLELLLQLFSSLDPKQIRQWDEQGKLYLDYVECVRSIPELERSVFDTRSVSDAAERQQLHRLARVVPALLASLPSLFQHSTDLKAKVALGEMLSTLLKLVNPLRNYGLSHLPVMHSGILQEQARLQYVQRESHGRFLRSLSSLEMAF